MLAHATATLPGAAVRPDARGLARMQAFKQRRGPFLLLAADAATALRQARWISPLLRRMARAHWPGPTTLVFPARPGLPRGCYQQGGLALRVDASPLVRLLVRHAGGLLLSSSLNRRGGAPAMPERRRIWRWHRHFDGFLPWGEPGGRASQILRVWRDHCTRIRP